jgi:hypothetical protein
MSEENKAQAHRLPEVIFNQGNAALVDELLASD